MQLNLIDLPPEETAEKRKRRSGAFTDNMKLPFHRWFRYSAGFSAEWVEDVIATHGHGKDTKVLDPFCGSGTTLLAASKVGVDSVGFETHPFVARIAESKLDWNVDVALLEKCAHDVVSAAKKMNLKKPASTSTLILKCYTSENLIELESLRRAYIEMSVTEIPDNIRQAIWLAITCILRETSGVGTAQWQYVLPNKTKAKVSNPYAAFMARISMFSEDILFAQDSFKGVPRLIEADARDPDCEEEFDLVITSPPYPNNYDYADATRLEMTFWEEIASWGDLHDAVRRHLIRSCSQHSAKERLELRVLLEEAVIEPIRDELQAVCNELDIVRQTKGGKKTYHTMVAAYFVDLAKVFISVRRLTKEGAKVAFVIGDSAPYGVYVPCDEWLGRLAIAAGFKSFHFEKLRDRNIKWKNRKHRVPLKEGILWIEG